MKDGDASEVLLHALFGRIPSLSDVDIVRVAVELDDVDAEGAAAVDDASGGDEIIAKLEVVAMPGEVVIKDVVPIKSLGYNVIRFEDVVDQNAFAGLLSRSGESPHLGMPLRISLSQTEDFGRSFGHMSIISVE